MSLECGECERDLRGGHDQSCSRWKRCPKTKDGRRCVLEARHEDEDEWNGPPCKFEKEPSK